jgi:hypothetical protein
VLDVDSEFGLAAFGRRSRCGVPSMSGTGWVNPFNGVFIGGHLADIMIRSLPRRVTTITSYLLFFPQSPRRHLSWPLASANVRACFTPLLHCFQASKVGCRLFEHFFWPEISQYLLHSFIDEGFCMLSRTFELSGSRAPSTHMCSLIFTVPPLDMISKTMGVVEL